MCGITGFYNEYEEIDATEYYSSHLLIRHRGPDDEGFIVLHNNDIQAYKGNDTVQYFQKLPHIKIVSKAKLIFGHRRLSIIDVTYHGHQPMTDEKNRFYITYNGEIFNYLELRKELENLGYHFHTNTDTEVILKAYSHWKEDCFNKFNGMWALAIFDKEKNRLILSRDRFGIKPLFYAYINHTLYFSSEIKFIKAFLPQKLNFHKENIRQYLKNCYLNYSDQTLFQEISELSPGHYLKLENKTVKKEKYWHFTPQNQDYSEEEAQEKFAYLFEDAVKLRMRADVEVGSLLSGGLDSGSIIGALNTLGYIHKNLNYKSFSAVFQEDQFSEKKYIDKLLSQIPLKSYFVYPKAELLEQYLDKMLYHLEQPFRSLSIFSQFLIYELVKKETNVKVLLNGQGGDELFGGYNKHYRTFLIELMSRGKFNDFQNEKELYEKNRLSHIHVGLGFFKNVIKALFQPNYFNQVTFNELKKSALREYLTYDDRNAMAFSLEARVPFLDYRLVEFAFSLDTKFKIQNFTNKKIVRQYAKNKIPNEIINRPDKMGFISPQEVWQKNQLKPYMDKTFRLIKEKGLLDFDTKECANWVQSYQDYQNGAHQNWASIWRMFCLKKWEEQWL